MPLRNILVPLDGSRLGARVLALAESLLAPGGLLTLLRVVEVPDARLEPFEYDRLTTAEAAMRLHLERLAGTLASRPRTQALLRRDERGHPADVIVGAAREPAQDLVAMSTHGRTAVERWVRGSVAERVLRTCEAPLLLCTPAALREEHARFQRVVVPLDGSERAARILPLVEEVARAHGSRVTLLRVEPLPAAELLVAAEAGPPPCGATPATASLEPHRARLAGAGVDVEVVSACGVVAAEVLQRARHADLLAMSTHGRTGLSRLWFGSVAEQVLRHAPCPLLVQRSAPVPEAASRAVAARV